MNAGNQSQSAHKPSRGALYIMIGMIALATAIFGSVSRFADELRDTRVAFEPSATDLNQSFVKLNENWEDTNNEIETAQNRLNEYSLERIIHNTIGSLRKVEEWTPARDVGKAASELQRKAEEWTPARDVGDAASELQRKAEEWTPARDIGDAASELQRKAEEWTPGRDIGRALGF